jgi:hypothetical protein
MASTYDSGRSLNLTTARTAKSSFCAVDGLIESVGKEELTASSDDQEHFRTIVLFDNVRSLSVPEYAHCFAS